MKPIAPQPTTASRAASEIRAAIVDGSLSPGTRMRQEELAARLGVSREPIRKAIVMLEREGLINSVSNRGAIVAPLDLRLISDISGFREAIEPYVAAIVARKTDFDGTVLRAIVAQGRKAAGTASLERLTELDLRFHSELYRASGNSVVIEVMATQWVHIRRAMLAVLTRIGFRKQVWEEHAAIAQAISQHKISLARTLARAHIRGARSWLASGFHA